MLRIRELREKRGKSQQWLAMKLNVSQTMISKYELGLSEPDISTLICIAKTFNVSLDYLIGVSDNKLNTSITGLSASEKELLHNYKCLTEIQKEKLQAYLQGLLQN